MGDGDMLTKRITSPPAAGVQNISSSAGGTISVVSVNSASVINGTEWASFAARYQQYRVRAIKLTIRPVYPVNTATVNHGVYYVSDYIGSAVPTSGAQVLSDEQGSTFDTNNSFTFAADWSRNPNAKLWNPTTAAPPTANQFGIAIGSPTGLLSVSTTYGYWTSEFVVEFRGSQ